MHEDSQVLTCWLHKVSLTLPKIINVWSLWSNKTRCGDTSIEQWYQHRTATRVPIYQTMSQNLSMFHRDTNLSQQYSDVKHSQRNNRLKTWNELFGQIFASYFFLKYNSLLHWSRLLATHWVKGPTPLLFKLPYRAPHTFNFASYTLGILHQYLYIHMPM